MIRVHVKRERKEGRKEGIQTSRLLEIHGTGGQEPMGSKSKGIQERRLFFYKSTRACNPGVKES